MTTETRGTRIQRGNITAQREREGGREGGSEGGREGVREGGRKGGSEGGRERDGCLT